MTTPIRGITIIDHQHNNIAQKDLPPELQETYPKGLKNSCYRAEVRGTRRTALTWQKAIVTYNNLRDKHGHRPTLQQLQRRTEAQSEIIADLETTLLELREENTKLFKQNVELERTAELHLNIAKTAKELTPQQVYYGLVQILQKEGRLYSSAEIKEALVTIKYHLGLKDKHSTYVALAKNR